MKTQKLLESVHPGDVLLEDFLKPMGITQYKLAKDIGVPQIRISQIIHKQRGVTVDTAARLAKYFGVSPELWLGLQQAYDLETFKRSTEWKKLDLEIHAIAA